jgi:hypothetical protein
MIQQATISLAHLVKGRRLFLDVLLLSLEDGSLSKVAIPLA